MIKNATLSFTTNISFVIFCFGDVGNRPLHHFTDGVDGDVKFLHSKSRSGE